MHGQWALPLAMGDRSNHLPPINVAASLPHSNIGELVLIMKRVSMIRLILAIFISVGLTLAPVLAARMMPFDANASSVQTTARAAPSTDENCSCCKLAAHCFMAMCAIYCPQFSQISAMPNDFALVGHAAFAGLPHPQHEGLARRPPIPPPRA